MSAKYFKTLLVLCSLMSHAQAFLKCNIKFFEEDAQNWKDLFSGYLLGMHGDTESTKENCGECNTFGDDLGKLNRGLVLIEQRKDAWFNKNNIITQDISRLGSTLLDVYLLFMNVF